MARRRSVTHWLLVSAAALTGVCLMTLMMAGPNDTYYVLDTADISLRGNAGLRALRAAEPLILEEENKYGDRGPKDSDDMRVMHDVIEQRDGSKKSNHSAALRNMRNNMTMKDFDATHVSDIIERIEINKKEGLTVNPHPFKYISNGENLCKDKNIFLIVYVHTAPSHFKHRSMIRQTWGNARHYPDAEVRVVFVMGLDETGGNQPAVAFESAQYGDIVQEDFRDTYRNLTYKAIAALKWVSTYCPQAEFVLKSDDDMFVNMFSLIRHLRSLATLSNVRKHLLLCLVWDRMPVLREGKWGVSERELKADFYPVYCSGSAFVMTTDVVVSMHEASYAVPFFWVDDFYVTGLLTMRVPDLDRRQFISTYELDGLKLEEKFNGPQWYLYIFSHLRVFSSYVNVWNRLVELANGAGTPKIEFRIPAATD